VRLIVAGAGWAGQAHLAAIRALEEQGADCHLAGLVDVDREHLARTAGELHVEATYSDLAEALASCREADAVVLATPHDVHRAGTVQAAAAGKHVLVEKPMALTLADADAMIRACDDAGVTLMVAESARYQLAHIKLRELIAAGTVGQVLSGRVNFIGRGRHTYGYPGRRAWLADPKRPGSGIWMLNGIHQMSVARMLFGEPTRVYARQVHSKKFRSTLEATIVAMLSFDCGPEVTMTVSAELHGYKTFGDTVVFGADGTLRLDHGRQTVTVYTESDRRPEVIECSEPRKDGPPAHFVRQMQEFLAAVAERRKPATSGPSERRTLAAILAGYESLRTGQAVGLG